MREASGVVFLNGSLWVVANESDGRVFRFEWAEAESAELAGEARYRRLDPDDAAVERLPAGPRASDLESVDFASGGRLFVLSEDRRTLFGTSREEMTFTNHLWAMERDGVGLEGLAIRGTERGDVFAVLWEGRRKRDNPEPPRIIVRREGAGLSDTVAELDRPLLNGLLDGRKLRAADLVWTRVGGVSGGDSNGGWGFIVLVHCESKGRAEHKWLVRVDEAGRGAGEPLRLRDVLAGAHGRSAKRWAAENWEGLGWVIPGRRLVMVNDSDGETFAVLVDLPEAWGRW